MWQEACYCSWGMKGILTGRNISSYLAPAYPMLIAAGAVLWERWLESPAPNRLQPLFHPTWTALAIGALVSGALALPPAPINSPLWNITSEVHDTFTEQIGWPEMIATVASIHANLPEEEKPRAGILTAENDEAAALNLYGSEYGLPRAISGSDTFWLRGYGDPPPETLIVVGFSQEDVASVPAQCEVAGTITNPYGVENDLRDPPHIFVCSDLRISWSEFWDRVKRYS